MTVSQTSARDLREILGIPGDRIDIVTEAADPIFCVLPDPNVGPRAKKRHGVPANAELLVYVGGLNRHKNVLGLLRAMPLVLAARPAVHLAIVGDTSGRGFWDNVPELMRFVAQQPLLAQHVHFTGRLEDAELVELLNAASALVLPSLWEGFGLPAVEAMACGLPVLASRRGSLPEVVADAGLFFEPDSPQAIAGCVLEFLENPAAQARLRRAALHRAGTFSWARAAELAEESFRRCHAQEAARSAR
jgi:alpha-1,3-rhamnosyl/mannosyltransferase